MVEAMGLNVIASRSPWMASPAYQIYWKFNQSVQRIYTEPLYLKPAMPLGRFFRTVKYVPWLPRYISQRWYVM